MSRRLFLLIVLLWALGFAWFTMTLPQPANAAKSEGAIVLTGGGGRIDRGLEALRKGWTQNLLVSGVDREVKPREFAVEYHVAQTMMTCCITLGFDSVDTRSNAREAARWIAKNDLSSVRLITTDWHMRRAAFELGHAVPSGVEVIRDAVPSHPSLRALFYEYNKLLARRLASAMGL